MATFQYGMLVEGITLTATAAGVTSLTSTSRQLQVFTGSTTQTVRLPATTGMVIGQFFEIYNTSTGVVTVQFQDATSFTANPTISASGGTLVVKLTSVGTTNGTWVVQNVPSLVAGSLQLQGPVGIGTAPVASQELTVTFTEASTGGNTGTISNYLNATNTAMTSTSVASVGAITRTITTSTTDTANLLAFQVIPTFNISSGQTYSNNSGSGFTGFFVNGPNTPVGTLAISNYAGIKIGSNTVATGTRKSGIFIDTQANATNNAAIVDNATFTGNFFINSTSANPSLLSGALTVASTITATGGNISAVSSVTNAALSVVINNTKTATSTTDNSTESQLFIKNDAGFGIRMQQFASGASAATSPLTGGPTGVQGAVFTDTAYPLVFGTVNAFSFLIDTAQNVGFGVTSVNAKIEAAGKIRASRSGSQTQYLQMDGGDGSGIYLYSSSGTGAEKNFFINNQVTGGGVTANTTIQFQIQSTTKMILDSVGRLSLGDTLPVAADVITGSGGNSWFNVTGNASNAFPLNNIAVGNNSNGAFWTSWKSRSTTGSATAITTGDNIATFRAYGANGTNYQIAAIITMGGDANGTVSGTSMPGKVIFATTPNGSNTPSDRMTIDMGGHVLINRSTDSGLGILQADGNADFAPTSGTAFARIRGAASTQAGFFAQNASTGTSGSDGLGMFIQTDNTTASIWNYENGIMQFGTNNSERVRIDASGNVGTSTRMAIGQVTAQANWSLYVAGQSLSGGTQVGIGNDTTFTSTGTTEFQSFRSSPHTAAAAYTVSAGYHYYVVDANLGAGSAITTQYGYYAPALAAAGTNWAFYSVSAASFFGGLVHLGNVNPSSATALYVDAKTLGLGATFNSTHANGIAVNFKNSGTTIGYVGTGAQISSGGFYTPTANDFGINASGAHSLLLASNDSVRALFDSSGNFGINVTPATLLHLKNTSGSTTIRIDGSSGDNAAVIQMWGSSTVTSNWRIANNATISAAFEIAKQLTSTPTFAAPQFVIDTNGAFTLGASDVTAVATAKNSAATASSTKRGYDAQYTVDTDCTGGYFYTCLNSAGTIIGRIEASANTTTSFTGTSDSRLKTDPSDFDGLDLIASIKPKEFGWISNPGTRHKGFYAQELYTVLPEAVSVGDDTLTADGSLANPWGVDYGKLTPVLVKAVQELKEQLDQVKSDFEAYQAAHP